MNNADSNENKNVGFDRLMGIYEKLSPEDQVRVMNKANELLAMEEASNKV